MTSPKPDRPAGDGDRDAEITALLLGELRAATAAARARGATNEQVHRLIEQRRAALRRTLPGAAPDPRDHHPGSDAVSEPLPDVAADTNANTDTSADAAAVPQDPEHRGDDPLDLRGIA